MPICTPITACRQGTKDITADWVAVLRLYGGQMNTDGAALPIVGNGDLATLAADAPDSSLAAAEAYLQKYDQRGTSDAGRRPTGRRVPAAHGVRERAGGHAAADADVPLGGPADGIADSR